MGSNSKSTYLCAHCCSPAYAPIYLKEGLAGVSFCCMGCRSLYLFMLLINGEDE